MSAVKTVMWFSYCAGMGIAWVLGGADASCAVALHGVLAYLYAVRKEPQP